MNNKLILKALLDSFVLSLLLLLLILFFIKTEYKEKMSSYIYDANRGSIYNLEEDENKTKVNCNNLKIKKIFNNSVILKSDGKDIFICKKGEKDE